MSQSLGWSFPSAEAVALIRRLIQWPCGRVIDIGAGRGLWTKVLKRAFGSDKVVGLPGLLHPGLQVAWPPVVPETLISAIRSWC